MLVDWTISEWFHIYDWSVFVQINPVEINWFSWCLGWFCFGAFLLIAAVHICSARIWILKCLASQFIMFDVVYLAIWNSYSAISVCQTVWVKYDAFLGYFKLIGKTVVRVFYLTTRSHFLFSVISVDYAFWHVYQLHSCLDCVANFLVWFTYVCTARGFTCEFCSFIFFFYAVSTMLWTDSRSL